MKNSVQRFAELQKERLEQIREATERERQLLHQHRTAAPKPSIPQSPDRDHAPLTSGLTPSRGSFESTLPTKQPSNWMDSSRDKGTSDDNVSLLERLAYGTRPSVVIANQLNERAVDLQAQEEDLRREEGQLHEQELAMERRVDKLNLVKKELLSKLVTLQFREKEQRDTEAMLDAELADLTRRQEEVRERQRELQHQKSVQATELAQREGALAAARKKLQDKEADMQRITQRLRQQTLELEDRVRGLELQLSTRQRLVEDLEREALREEMRVRDEELQAANDLRAEIDRRQLLLAGTVPSAALRH